MLDVAHEYLMGKFSKKPTILLIIVVIPIINKFNFINTLFYMSPNSMLISTLGLKVVRIVGLMFSLNHLKHKIK